MNIKLLDLVLLLNLYKMILNLNHKLVKIYILIAKIMKKDKKLCNVIF